MTKNEIPAVGSAIAFEIWNVEAKAVTRQTGVVKKVGKGVNPLVLITPDRPELRYDPSLPLKVRLSDTIAI